MVTLLKNKHKIFQNDLISVQSDPVDVLQRYLKIRIDDENKKKLLVEFNDDISKRLPIIMHSRSTKYASSWLIDIPTDWRNSRHQKACFQLLLKYHTGIALSEKEFDCPACEQKSKSNAPIPKMDIYGDHALSCPSTSSRIARHDRLIKILYKHLQEAKISCDEEERSGEFRNTKMGDIVINDQTWNKKLWLDFSVVSPMCPTYFEKSVKEPGSAIEERVKEKEKKYEQDIIANRANFQAIVVDIFGFWHVPAMKTMKNLCRNISNATTREFKSTFVNLFKELSTSLQKHNGEMLAARSFNVEI